MSDEIKTTDTMEIVVDDGMRDVRIRNLKGEQIGLFKFRPTDMGIIDRYNKLVKDFDAITEPLADVSIKADGTAESELDTSKLNEAEQRLYAACDEMFGGNMSEAFFGKMHPFSPVNPFSKNIFQPFSIPVDSLSLLKIRKFLHFSLYNRTFLW